MADDSQEVADIIDALGEAPAPLEVYNATRDYDTRYLASAGAAAAAAGGGGGSQSVKIVDLGVIDLAGIAAAGPTDLYTLAAGEFLAGIRFTDTDVELADVVPLAIGFGTPHSFGWFGFAWIEAAATVDPAFGLAMFDTLALAANQYAYQPDAAVFGVKEASSFSAMVLSTPGAVQVAAFVPSVLAQQAGFGNGFRYAAAEAWAAATAYDDLTPGTPGTTEPPHKAAILANGTVWTNTGTAGTSANTEPDFAGHAGGNIGEQDVYAITAVDQAGGTITVAGDHAAEFTTAGFFDITGSTGNDGTYSVSSATFTSGHTVLDTGSPLPDATADGSTVVDNGSGIEWTDQGIGTTGTVHAVAEIWTLT